MSLIEEQRAQEKKALRRKMLQLRREQKLLNIPDEPSSPATVSHQPDDASVSQASLSKVGEMNFSFNGNRHDLTVSKRKIRIL